MSKYILLENLTELVRERQREEVNKTDRYIYEDVIRNLLLAEMGYEEPILLCGNGGLNTTTKISTGDCPCFNCRPSPCMLATKSYKTKCIIFPNQVELNQYVVDNNLQRTYCSVCGVETPMTVFEGITCSSCGKIVCNNHRYSDGVTCQDVCVQCGQIRRVDSARNTFRLATEISELGKRCES